MIGPRTSVIRELMGEHVPLEELLMDQSEFVDSDLCTWRDLPELWIDLIREPVGWDGMEEGFV